MWQLIFLYFQNHPELLVDGDQDGVRVFRDCDDSNAAVNPQMQESCQDNVDNNCDGVVNENCPRP